MSFILGRKGAAAGKSAPVTAKAGQAAPAGRTGAFAGGDLVMETTTQTFARDVLDASRTVPVLVDFWAPWCGPCKQLAPALEKVVREANGAVKLVKMNIDEHPSIAGQLGIRSIPAVIAFRNGQPVDGFMGAVPESQIRELVERLAGPVDDGGIGALLTEADELLAGGDPNGAANIFASILQVAPESVQALAGLARCSLELDRVDEAREVLAMVPAEDAGDPAIQAVQKALALREQAEGLGDVRDLERRVAADPNDFQARLDLATNLAARKQREPAVDQLIEIMRRDRSWNDDAARKQLVAFFEAWGPKDPATIAGRRRLSSLLFA